MLSQELWPPQEREQIQRAVWYVLHQDYGFGWFSKTIIIGFNVGGNPWIEHLAEISQSIKKYVENQQKCSGKVPKRPGNRFGQLVGTHYSIWVHNPNDFHTISSDFA